MGCSLYRFYSLRAWWNFFHIFEILWNSISSKFSCMWLPCYSFLLDCFSQTWPRKYHSGRSLWQAFLFYCRTTQITQPLSWVIQHGLEVWNLDRKWSKQVISWHQKTWRSGLWKHLRGWTILWTQNALESQQIWTGNLTIGWFPMKFLVLCFLSGHKCHENSFPCYI